MKIASISLNPFWQDKKSSFDLCHKYIKQASKKSVDLIIFPEMTLTGFSNNVKLLAEEKDNSSSILKFSKLSKKFKIAIVFGVVIKIKSKIYNQCVFINKKGKILGDYSKIHSFSYAQEDKYFASGKKISIISFNDFKIGLSICYDLRFPELYSALAKKSDIIINIASWPKKRINHWRTLLKARAIENQLYVIGVNRTGIDGNKLKYNESSLFYNALGKKIKSENFSKMKIYTLLKKDILEYENNFNAKKDRKIELYKTII